jgi:hypothetical protein
MTAIEGRALRTNAGGLEFNIEKFKAQGSKPISAPSVLHTHPSIHRVSWSFFGQ